jgi:hypothetical protein
MQPEAEVAHLAEAVIKRHQGSSGTHQGSSGTHQAYLAEAARVEEQILGLEIAVDDLMRETISGRQRRRRSG